MPAAKLKAGDRMTIRCQLWDPDGVHDKQDREQRVEAVANLDLVPYWALDVKRE
jgi:hypothetical protein